MAIPSADIAPIVRLASRPSRNRTIVGMLRMANLEASPGRASVSTLATTALPPRERASDASSGATTRQGPHHAASWTGDRT